MTPIKTITEDNISDIDQYFEHVYVCKNCNIKYGSDKEDKSQLCPNCEL